MIAGIWPNEKFLKHTSGLNPECMILYSVLRNKTSWLTKNNIKLI